jgi:hypothetical protein
MTAARCESDQHHGGESVTWHQQVGHILHALRKLEVHLRRRGEEYCERVRGGAREGRHDHASVHQRRVDSYLQDNRDDKEHNQNAVHNRQRLALSLGLILLVLAQFRCRNHIEERSMDRSEGTSTHRNAAQDGETVNQCRPAQTHTHTHTQTHTTHAYTSIDLDTSTYKRHRHKQYDTKCKPHRTYHTCTHVTHTHTHTTS